MKNKDYVIPKQIVEERLPGIFPSKKLVKTLFKKREDGSYVLAVPQDDIFITVLRDEEFSRFGIQIKNAVSYWIYFMFESNTIRKIVCHRDPDDAFDRLTFPEDETGVNHFLEVSNAIGRDFWYPLGGDDIESFKKVLYSEAAAKALRHKWYSDSINWGAMKGFDLQLRYIIQIATYIEPIPGGTLERCLQAYEEAVGEIGRIKQYPFSLEAIRNSIELGQKLYQKNIFPKDAALEKTLRMIMRLDMRD